MRKVFLILFVTILCISNVSALEDITDTNQDALLQDLPSEAQDLLEDIDPHSHDFVSSVLSIFMNALGKSTNALRQGLRTSGILLVITLLCSICSSIGNQKSVSILVGVLGVFAATLGSFHSMVRLSQDTITELTDYSALLLPIMASAMAISGNPITAGGIQALTALFATLFMRVITKLLIPGVYLYLALAAGENALQNSLLGELREFIAWLIEKVLRILMYVFTVFLSLTGVISGAADAVAVKTTKAAVSGMVPVVGSILSDASETLLTGAATVKNSIGILGMLAVIGMTLLPFLRVGIQYLIMKVTAACSGAVALKEHTSMLKHISTAMGMLLAMTGTCGALLLISGVCYLKVSGI